ncbi:MAG: DUF1549 domain-containing protein, partial [Planctomycetales bacterium]
MTRRRAGLVVNQLKRQSAEQLLLPPLPPMRISCRLLAVSLVLLLLTSAAVRSAEPVDKPPTAEQLAFFENEIRPILAKHCYACHSVKAKKLKAELLLDSRAGALKGGDNGPAVVPGSLEKSLLIEAIQYESLEMPPRGKLSPKQIAALTEWVKIGAPWPKEAAPQAVVHRVEFDWKKRRAEHWSWKPLQRSNPPAVKQSDWPRSEIDRFILAKLEAKGLRPSPPAEKSVLLRRVYFDLIGLPPSREQVQAFIADESPHAFENAVDALLKSSHFGEKWARHWMDLTRYAESYGHEFDYPIRHAHQYRDYLIRAYNADVPYDQFLTEHIAGDLLNKPRRHPAERFNESIVGTGFWYFGEATHSPTDVRDDEAGRVANQIDVFGRAFLGMSLACARCHDHKFDAITTKDYYALSGMLQSSRKQEAMLDPQGKIHEAAERMRKLQAEGGRILREGTGTNQPTAESFAVLLSAAQESLDSAEKPGKPSAAVLAKVAQKHGVEQATLGRWVALLANPDAQKETHYLFAWSKLAAAKASDPKQFADHKSRWLSRLNSLVQRATDAEKQAASLIDFSDPESGFILPSSRRPDAKTNPQEKYPAKQWFVTGEAFGAGPTTAGEWDV